MNGVDPGYIASEPEQGEQRRQRAERSLLGRGDQAAMDALVERCKTDPGAPFEPRVIDELRVLYEKHRDKYERLRDRLKKETDVRVAALSELIERTGQEEEQQDLSGQEITYPEIVPWGEPVNGEALLTDLSETIGAT
jgi:hypothetical protein